MSGYTLIGELGRGGMGVVYRATQENLHREVALKLLLAAAEEVTDVGVARFKREMAVLIELSHPGIVKLLDAGEMDGQRFYVMELLQGRDLASLRK